MPPRFWLSPVKSGDCSNFLIVRKRSAGSIRPQASVMVIGTGAAAECRRSAMEDKWDAGRQDRSASRRSRPETPEFSRSGSRAGLHFCCGRRPRRLLQGYTWRPGFPSKGRQSVTALVKKWCPAQPRGRKSQDFGPNRQDRTDRPVLSKIQNGKRMLRAGRSLDQGDGRGLPMAVAPGARRLPINLKPAALRRVLFFGGRCSAGSARTAHELPNINFGERSR